MKRDISKLIKAQVPRFVVKEYPQFIKLLEYYYKFNEEQGVGVSIEDVRRPSKTTTKFKEYLLKEYGSGLPLDIVNSDQFDENFILQLKDLYSKKGTDKSIKELFDKVLPLILDKEADNFSSDVEIDRPFERVLKVSDAKWVTNSSIFVKFTDKYKDVEVSGLVVDHAIHTDRVTGKATKFYPYRTEDVVYYENQGEYKQTRKGFLQLYTKDNIDFKLDDIITIAYDNGVEVVANIISNTAKIQIEDGGENFKPNELLFVPITDLEGNDYSGLVIRVTNVDNRGSILEFDVLNFAVDVPYSDIVINVGNNLDVSETINIYTKPKVIGNDILVFILTKANLFSDYGRLEHHYVDPSIKSALYFGFLEYGGYSFEKGIFYYEPLANAILFQDGMSVDKGKFYTDGTRIYKAHGSGIWTNTDMDHDDEWQDVNGVLYENICDYYRDEFNFLTKTRNFGDYREGSIHNADSFDTNLGKPGFLGKSENKNAKFRIVSDAVANYNGYYESGIGLLDDISKLQDGGENNQFAYVLYSETDPEAYRDVMNNTVHPVGNIRFSKKVIYNEFTENVTPQSAVDMGNRKLILFIDFEVLDHSTSDDNLFAKYIIKPLENEFRVGDVFDRIFTGIRERFEVIFFNDFRRKDITKLLEESPKFLDETTKHSNRQLKNLFSILDDVREQVKKGTYLEKLDLGDFIVKRLTKLLEENPKFLDYVFKDFSRKLYDKGLLSDNDYWEITKNGLADAVKFKDTLTRKFERRLFDVSLFDDIIPKRFVIEPFRDQVTLMDAIENKDISKGVIAEKVTILDVFDKYLNKILLDSVSLYDHFDRSKYTKGLDDLFNIKDDISKDIERKLNPLKFTAKDIFEKFPTIILNDDVLFKDIFDRGQYSKGFVDILKTKEELKKEYNKDPFVDKLKFIDSYKRTFGKNAKDTFKLVDSYKRDINKTIIDKVKSVDGGLRIYDMSEDSYYRELKNRGFDANLMDLRKEKFGDLTIKYEINETYGFTDTLDTKGRKYQPLNIGLWSDYKDYIK